MNRLMKNRAAFGIGAFLAGAALGGTGLLALPANKVAIAHASPAPALPFFSFDLEEKQGGPPRDPKGPLRLVAEPVRVGKAGLLVRVEVWNPSVEERLVHPISPSDYQLSFRDAAGQHVEAYLLRPGTRRRRDQSEFAWIDYGNCLATNYLLPTFYDRIRQKDLECRVRISTIYYLDSMNRTADFELSSVWVKVPPP